ncbi:MAG TPA: PHP domain-containing protein, partial [Bacteroidales bacterium]|nr:PHP domain-containing protein [Bacteroidales bacterium]
MLFTAHSYYSLRYGSMPVDQVVTEAKAKGLREMVLADINNTSAITDFIRECKEHNIRPIAGVSCHKEGELQYTLIARNNQGFREINDFLSELNIKGLELPERAPELGQVYTVYPFDAFLLQDPNPKTQIPSPKFQISSSREDQSSKEIGVEQPGLRSHHASGLASLPIENRQSEIGNPLSSSPRLFVSLPPNHPLLPMEFIGIRHHELNKFITSPLRHYPGKLLAWHNATFADAKGFELHRHLRAIDNNCLLSKLPPSQLANPNEVFIAEAEAQRRFSQYPQLLENSRKLLEQCELSFDFKNVKNKKTFTGSRYDDRILLEKLAMDGLAYRYGS